MIAGLTPKCMSIWAENRGTPHEDSRRVIEKLSVSSTESRTRFFLCAFVRRDILCIRLSILSKVEREDVLS